MARVVSKVVNGPPSLSLIGPISNARRGVVVGETQVASPNYSGPVIYQGISSPVRIRGSVIELSGQVKNKAIKVLIDSGATSNFITEGLTTTWNLPVEQEA